MHIQANQQLIHSWPAQVWVGQHAIAFVIDYLQKRWCAAACQHCAHCIGIKTRNHHSLLWISPEKQYTRVQLEPVFEILTRKLSPQEHFFFVLESVELLTQACANSLLKSLEEPPLGYHFLLLTNRPGALLPTVASRCIRMDMDNYTHNVLVQGQGQYEHLADILLQARFDQLKSFASYIDTVVLVEHEALLILDMLIAKLAQQKPRKQSTEIFNSIEHFYKQPPMPGAMKLFVKALFVRLAALVDPI